MEKFEFHEIVNIVKRWKAECGFEGSVFISKEPGCHRTLYLYMSHPAVMIGPYGYFINKYKEEITEKFPAIHEIKMVEVFKQYA